MDETFDFIIVGSGGGSMCAALLMKSVGKEPLILEKTELFGGTTARSGGVMWIPNNRFMAPAGVEDSPDKAMAYMDAVIGDDPTAPGASRARRQTYVSEAPRMLDFLVSQGIKLRRYGYWPDYYDEMPGGSAPGRAVVADLFNANELGEHKKLLRPNFMQIPAMLEEAMPVGHYKTTWKGKRMMVKIGIRAVLAKLTGKHWVTAGNALQGRMFQAAIKAKVDMRNNAAVKRLIQDGDGKVTGVVAEIGGEERRFFARDGVLVNAGGFAHNKEMRAKYQPEVSTEWTNTQPGDTGEMILEMMRVGAAIAQMNEMVGNQMTFPPDNNSGVQVVVQGDAANPHSIVVDQSGTRYMREAGSYMKFCQDMIARNKISPAIPSWIVFDSQYLPKYMLAGSMPGRHKPKSWLESGFLKTADTLEDLARICEMDPANLRASVERFNGFAKAGKDDDFHRGERNYDRFLGDPAHSPPNLGTLEQAPFYAYKVYPGDVGTYGGVVTDTNARVLREDGSVIPGLYATGVSTASVMGRAYPGAGASVGPSFTWGFVAAKHAANVGNLAGAV